MSDNRHATSLANVAREELGLATLEVRGRDRLDFHDLYIGRIKAALERAFREGGVAAIDNIFQSAGKGKRDDI